MTDTLSDKTHADQTWNEASFDAPDSFVKTKDSKLRNLLNKKYKDIVKPLPDIPRKGKASLFF